MNGVNGIIFRGSDDVENENDPYVEKFKRVGIKAHLIPVLNFEYVNLNELNSKLKKPENYSGIIFSSPRCVKAVGLCGINMSIWKELKTFVVGEKTEKLTETELGLKSEGSTCGNARALAEYILKQSISKPLLLPIGSLSRPVLNNILTSGGVSLDTILVYQTIADPLIENNIKEVSDKNTIKYILYFSPSAVEITHPIFIKLGIELNNIRLCAIGQTTASALTERSLQVFLVPESPTPESFSTALEHLVK